MTQPALKERSRRTQAERRASTRTKLLDATIECLIELGYARTTTTEIAERAGLSRGAQLHHFPTKAELVTTAVEHLFERRHREFVQAFARRPAGADAAAAAIDILWSMVSGPTFHAWLELAVAARTDPELRARRGSVGRRFMRDGRADVPRAVPGTAEPPTRCSTSRPALLSRCSKALPCTSIAARDDGQVEDMLGALKTIARLVM